MRKYLKTFITGVICCVLVLSCLFSPVSSMRFVSADSGTVGSLVGYLMSMIGLVNTTSGGAIQEAGSDVTSSIADYVTQQMDNTVYLDSNGNYVFSNDFTQGLYNILNANSSTDVRVISGNSSYDGNFNWNYVSNAFTRAVDSNTSRFENSITVFYQTTTQNTKIYSGAVTFDTSNLAFFSYDSSVNKIRCMNGSLNYFEPSCYYVSQSFENDIYNSVYSTTHTSVNYLQGGYYTSSWTYNHFTFASDNYWFNHFPVCHATINSKDFILNCLSTRSYVIAKSSAAYNSYHNMSSGLICMNPSSIPSISQTAIQDNNWSEIYSNYVTNVRNTYNSDPNKVVSTNKPFDYTLLRKYMNIYTQSIIKAIEEGNENIEETIRTSNTWLKMIFNKLNQIYSLLDNWEPSGGGGSGGPIVITGSNVSGGGCNWSEQDIQDVLSALQRIENSIVDYTPYMSTMTTHLYNISENEADSYLKLGQIYVVLGTILQAIRSGGDPSVSIDDRFPDLFDYIHGLPDSDILDSIDTLDVASSMFEDVVPFCFLGATVAIVTGLSHEPIVLNTRIPFKFTSTSTGFSVDDGITIDFTPFDTVHNILIGSECIAFILLLMWISFKLLYYFLNLLGG